MTQPVPDPSSEKEQQLKRHLERGADITQEIRQRFPVTADIDSTAPVVIRVPGTKDARADDLEVHLTLRVTHSRAPDFAILVFLNTPDATKETPADAPGFAGSMAFFVHSEEHPGTSSGVRLPITEQFRRTRKQEDITVTVVPVPYQGRSVPPGKFPVSAAVELVSVKVTRR
jgi:hypothetical protein